MNEENMKKSRANTKKASVKNTLENESSPLSLSEMQKQSPEKKPVKKTVKAKPETSASLKKTRPRKKAHVDDKISTSDVASLDQTDIDFQELTPKKTSLRGRRNPISTHGFAYNVEESALQEQAFMQEEELEQMPKPRRGRPKSTKKVEQQKANEQELKEVLSQEEVGDIQLMQNSDSAQSLSFEQNDIPASEHMEPSEQNDIVEPPIREVTSQRRKPGRPPKRPSLNPITSLTKKTSLALEQTPRLPVEEKKRLALANRQITALPDNKKLAIAENKKLSLDEHKKIAIAASQNLELEEYHREEDMHPLVFSQHANEIGHDDNILILESDINDTKNINETSDEQRVNENADFINSRSKDRNQKKSRSSKKAKQQKKSADFIVGEYGTSQTIDAQNPYEAQAALGVMGIIDEAPHVDALLPFVNDINDVREMESDPEAQSLESVEKTSSRTSRRSRRGRKAEEKALKQDQEATSKDFYLDADSAPIAEGDELSLLEAEESIKQAGKTAKAKTHKEQLNRVLYVSCVPDEQVEVVITENGVVSEYFVEMEHQAKIRGNIYKGVINNVDTNLQAAFVNFGGGKNGFLQIDEVHPEYWLSPHQAEDGASEPTSKYPPIQKVLKVGQEVLVQVVKEPSGSKGAFLTTWISLAGRFIVLTPGQEQIGVSRKVEDNAERTRLRELLVGIKPGENMGVIIRTASEGASKANIQNDLKFLKRVWKDVQKKVQNASAPSLIHQEADLPSRAVRDYLTSDISEVWVDSEEVRDSLQDLITVVFPRNKNILKLHKDARSTLWERFNILRQLDEVTKREVVLPSGGRLVFDQTEALMAIDINSGKTHGKINFEAMVFRTNMEAVEAIARHLRLRDIGGQVVIDFIEMRDRGHCRDIEKAMRTAMKRDRARHDVGRLSSFGLLELVRQRTGTSAISISSEPCPHCRGTGFRRNLEWQAQGVLRDIKSKLSSGKNMPSTYVHHVEHEVAFYLLNKKRDRLSELEEKFSLKIEIHVK